MEYENDPYFLGFSICAVNTVPSTINPMYLVSFIRSHNIPFPD